MTDEKTPAAAPGKALVQTPDKEARTWAMVCHLAALAGLVCPFGNVIGPLIVWAVKHDASPFIDRQGRQAINFQLTVSAGIMIALPLIFLLIGIPLVVFLAGFDLIMTVVAAVRANDGEDFRYPCTLPFFR